VKKVNPLFNIRPQRGDKPGVIVNGDNSNNVGKIPGLPLKEQELPEAQNCGQVQEEITLADAERKARVAQLEKREQEVVQVSMRIQLAQEKVTAIGKDMAAFIDKHSPQADDLELKHFRERYEDSRLDLVKSKLKRDDFFAATEGQDQEFLRSKFNSLPEIIKELDPLESQVVQDRARWQKQSGAYTDAQYKTEYGKLKDLACNILVMRTKAKAISDQEAEFKAAIDKQAQDKADFERRHKAWAASHARMRQLHNQRRLTQLNRIISDLDNVIREREAKFRRDYRSGMLKLRGSVRGAVSDIVMLKRQRGTAEEERARLQTDLGHKVTPVNSDQSALQIPSEQSFEESSRSRSASLASKSLSRLESETITMLSASTAP